MPNPRLLKDPNGTAVPMGTAMDIGDSADNRNAAVADPDFSLAIPENAISATVYSSVDYIVRFDAAPTATKGLDVPAGGVSGLPCLNHSTIHVQARSGNLAIVSVAFETGD